MEALTGMLVAPGIGNDTQARFAVNGLTKYVSRPDAASEQRMYEQVLLEALGLNYHPAYDAMELQIIDNSAEKYAELEPYQYHGSVYGVAPADRGYLNPVGEWNTQEIIADGSQITVKVNGHTILKTDLQEAGKPETMNAKDHPGLFRENGHIGFLGHGDQVAFRNIRIRDLNTYLSDYSAGFDKNGGHE